MFNKLSYVIKLLANSLLILILLIFIYLVVALFLSIYQINEPQNLNNKEIDIFILNNGVHADIAVPVKSEIINWSNTIKFDYTYSKDSIHEKISTVHHCDGNIFSGQCTVFNPRNWCKLDHG